jgi:hypothetical protein
MFPSGKDLPLGRGIVSPVKTVFVHGTRRTTMHRHPARSVRKEQDNIITMNNLLNIIIVLLIAGWLVGYIGFGAMVGNLIHILLIVAVVVILYRILGGRKAPL